MERLVKVKIVFFLFIILLSFSSCKKEETFTDIKLPETPILSMTSRWGVITSAYLRLRNGPGSLSKPVATLWKGYILEIVSRNPEKKTVDDYDGYWYQVTYRGLQGWVFSAYLKFFDTREEAERTSRELRR